MLLINKILSILLLGVCLFPFSNKQTAVNQSVSADITDFSSFDGRAFFKVEQDSLGKYYIFKPCYAAVANYRINNDSISHDWGIETDYLYAVSKWVKNDTLFCEVLFLDSREYKDTIAFKKLDNEGVFWRINDVTFIDSIYSDRVPLVKEFCEDFYDR